MLIITVIYVKFNELLKNFNGYDILRIINVMKRKIFMSEEFEKLDSPLVVHKETDASYHETANIEVATATNQTGDNTANLVRHRFKKVKKKRKAPWFIFILVVIVAVICGLYFGDVIGNPEEKQTESTTNGGYLDTSVNRFEGVITVKKTYIFFEGEEINGTEELERNLKYLDKNTTLVIQDEEADSVFLDQEIIPLLKKYEIKYEGPKFIISSGLISRYEKTESKPTAAVEKPVSEN